MKDFSGMAYIGSSCEAELEEGGECQQTPPTDRPPLAAHLFAAADVLHLNNMQLDVALVVQDLELLHHTLVVFLLETPACRLAVDGSR